jgi:hypothetical protein
MAKAGMHDTLGGDHNWIRERDAVKMACSQSPSGTSDISFSSATMPPIPSPANRPLGRFWTAVFLAGAVIWTAATADYRFGEGDDGWQAPMVVHRKDQTLLTKDPLITEIGRYYQSGLFPLLAIVARQVGIARSYAFFFVFNRVLTIAAYYYFAWACTRRRSTAVLAAWLLTGFGYYGFGTYLSGTPMLEEKLVPRTMALPFALAGLAATVGGRPMEAGIWIVTTILLHPVTGVNTLGTFLVYGLLSIVASRRAANGDSAMPTAFHGHTTFGSLMPVQSHRHGTHAGGFHRFIAVGCILILFSGVFAWTQLRSDAPLWIDSAWRTVITPTVGAYVFIGQDTAWAPALFPTALVLGGIAILACRDPDLEKIAVKFGLAALFACVLHWVAVDRLGFHPLLEASPERTTYVIVAMAGVGLATWARSLATRSAVGMVLACGLTTAIVLRFDYRWLLVIVLAALVLSVPVRFRAISAVGVATAAACVALLAWRWQTAAEGAVYQWPQLTGISTLKALGITGDHVAQWETEQWIREHSAIEDVLWPPLKQSRGWQINSQRACLFNWSLLTYTHFSPGLARRYEESVGDARRLLEGTWEDLVVYAREHGAAWIITDDDYRIEHPDMPPADFARGPYEVRRIPTSK